MPQGLKEMREHEIVALAIKRGQPEEIADRLGISARQVQKWCEEPSGGGQPNPVFRINWFLDALNQVCPEGADLIVDYLRLRHAQRRGKFRRQMDDKTFVETCERLRAELNQVIGEFHARNEHLREARG